MQSALNQRSPVISPTIIGQIGRWLDQVDPGGHRRVKGLRLVTAYGIAALLGLVLYHSYQFPGGSSLINFAAGLALWASVSEGQATRWSSTRDLALLNGAAVVGAVIFLGFSSTPILGHPRPELILITGAFFVGYLKRFGILGAGVGSQIYIGQLLAYETGITRGDLGMVLLAGFVAAIASIVPRLLSGPAEHPTPPAVNTAFGNSQGPVALRMGLQSAIAALVIVVISGEIHLQQSAWAITASTYVIAGSAFGTADRVRRRIVGTLIGVPLGIVCLPIATHLPTLAWMLAAAAIMIYAIALPDRYDIACGAYAFALLVTLVMSGQTSLSLLAARAWETLIGGAFGVAAANFLLPIRPRPGKLIGATNEDSSVMTPAIFCNKSQR
jgi:hypothetical protein